MGPAGPGIVLLQGQRPTNRRVSWGATLYTDLDGIAFLRSIGAQRIYLWAYPAYWADASAIHRMAALAREHRVTGFVADLEDSYDANTLAEIRAAMVQEIGHGLDIGITSYPLWHGLESFRGVSTWLLTQIYPRDSMNAEDFERWYLHDAAIMPTYRLIATFVPPTTIGQAIATPDGYDHYLSMVLPRLGQTWGTWGSGPAWMQEKISTHRPMPWDTIVAVTTGGTIFGIHDGGYYAWLVICIVVLAAVAVAIFAWWKRR